MCPMATDAATGNLAAANYAGQYIIGKLSCEFELVLLLLAVWVG